MKPPLDITAWPVGIVRGLTGAVEGPIGLLGPAGVASVTGATGPTGPAGRAFVGLTGARVVGPTGLRGMTGPTVVGPAGADIIGPTGSPSPDGLAFGVWNGGLVSPTGPHDSQFTNMQGLKIKVTPVQTGNIYYCFTGTFANNAINGGMYIEVRRGPWIYAPNYHGSLAGAQLLWAQFRNLASNLRMEFVIEFVDNNLAVTEDYFYDLNVAVIPTGSLVTLYDLEWVLMEL